MADNVDCEKKTEEKKSKKKEPGIIYLSRIPTRFNVTLTRKYFEQFGEIGRSFLQPDYKAKCKWRSGRVYSEGWIEFQNKKIAKKVASAINNTPVGGKKKNKWRDELWNIKYLHRFKWTHLNESLAYEKAVHKQRMRTEISQAKREAEFHIANMQKQQHVEERKGKKKASNTDNDDEIEEEAENNVINLNNVNEDLLEAKSVHKQYKGSRKRVADVSDEDNNVQKKKAFLSKVFASGLDSDNDDEND
ncbi:Activator of basal transcription 1 [Mactra antiquata]